MRVNSPRYMEESCHWFQLKNPQSNPLFPALEIPKLLIEIYTSANISSYAFIAYHQRRKHCCCLTYQAEDIFGNLKDNWELLITKLCCLLLLTQICFWAQSFALFSFFMCYLAKSNAWMKTNNQYIGIFTNYSWQYNQPHITIH